MKRFLAMMLMAGVAWLAIPSITQAATLPGKLMALPNPPGAPQLDAFVVTLPHSHEVPARAVFTFTGQGHHTQATARFKKLNQYQYRAYWRAANQGTVRVQAYTAGNHLVAAASFPVTKAHTNVVGRVILGVVLVGGSLWLWYRQQKMFRPRN
ncbi:hypothetical protein [Sulfobacillus harzensis]|uniref:CopC domain-containing protein n=1 Tax=Sulfobacillus harzensis TaxID=2729629 RepID=A0A7Y0Q133_9FIRM|nr:hypothetical protein [Sulfobacillus harzensis]NMP21047.1 hypothetical protein [Sulfobacillus harzensis]